MSAHDRYLAAHSCYPVHVVCKDCEEEWDDEYETEYGAGWLNVHEQCPKCGSSELDFDELDEIDIQERMLEARGVDF